MIKYLCKRTGDDHQMLIIKSWISPHLLLLLSACIGTTGLWFWDVRRQEGTAATCHNVTRTLFLAMFLGVLCVLFPCLLFWETVTEVPSGRKHYFGIVMMMCPSEEKLELELTLSKTWAGFARWDTQAFHQQRLWRMASVVPVAGSISVHYFVVQSTNGKCWGWKA